VKGYACIYTFSNAGLGIGPARGEELSGVVLLQEVGYSSRSLGERRELLTNGHEPDGLGEPV
jgi:hypothetical protein